MKILTLNAWGGRTGQQLLDFFVHHQEIDVFLLQEIYLHATGKTCWDERDLPNLFDDIASVLPGYVGLFAPSVVHEWGLAAFVKNTLHIHETGDIFVHKTMDSLIDGDGSSIGRNLQFIKTQNEAGEPLTILNFHGIWAGHGVGKGDTEDRLQQSKNVISFIKTLSGNVVLGGDFNLSPDTESLNMIAQELGIRNLISEYGITSTRTSLYPKPGKFADYMFVSPEMQVKQFAVLPDIVSDHAPLLLEI